MYEENFTTRKAVQAIFLSILIIIFAQGISSFAYKLPIPIWLKAAMFGVLYVTIAYVMIKLLCNKILNISLEECHIKKPTFSILWIILSLMLPLIVSGILLYTPGELVKNNMNNKQIMNIVVSAIFTVGLGAGVVEEMVFRGVIMTALDKRWGRKIAILIPSVIFGLLHAIGRNMNLTDILLLFVAGTSVGIMFSLIVYESGSIWTSAIVHGVWNIAMIGKILNIGIEHNKDAIFSYKIQAKSVILTGGEFGVEASIVAVLGYILVIIITLALMKRKSTNIQKGV